MSSLLYDHIGPKGRRLVQIFNVVVLGAIALVLGSCLYALQQRGQLSAELWSVIHNPDFLFLLLTGLLSTLKVAGLCMLLSIVFGLMLMFGLMSHNALIRLPVRGWMELFRGLPLLLLIFFVYLGTPALGFDVSTFWSLVIGITLYNSAVLGEIFRGGIASIHGGQQEGGLAIGLSDAQVLRIILLPQAVRRMLPVLISQLVIILKETSLGFVIGYTELLREGRTAVEYLGGQYSIPVYTAMAVVYITLNICLSSLAAWLDRRMNY
jgi:glutamate transport system permease protein